MMDVLFYYEGGFLLWAVTKVKITLLLEEYFSSIQLEYFTSSIQNFYKVSEQRYFKGKKENTHIIHKLM